MARNDENGAVPPSKRDHHHRRKSVSVSEPDPDSDSDSEESSRKSKRSSSSRRSTSRDTKRTKTLTSGSSKRRRSRDSSSDSYISSSDYDSESDSDSEDSDSRRRRRKERKRKDEKRRREKEKEKKKKRREKEKEKKRKRKEKKKDKGKKGAVTGSWGKYGIIKETDMWNKRPEFTAWLSEVKKVNLESLPNWEEKQLFKDFMEDHNTATFPSKKYYNLDAYYERQMVKDMKKGISKVQERTIFNDEEQRRLELQREREKQKVQEVEALKRSMQSGMAQAMKEQAQLREEMALHYKLGNSEAAAAIQRRLDPDVPT